MKRTMEEMAATIGRNEELAEMLDAILTDSGDRAYVVCSALECRNNENGHCTIHTVKGERKILGNGRCAEYVV